MIHIVWFTPSNVLRVSRLARTRDRSTYAEWTAGYVGCTRELGGVATFSREARRGGV